MLPVWIFAKPPAFKLVKLRIDRVARPVPLVFRWRVAGVSTRVTELIVAYHRAQLNVGGHALAHLHIVRLNHDNRDRLKDSVGVIGATGQKCESNEHQGSGLHGLQWSRRSRIATANTEDDSARRATRKGFPCIHLTTKGDK